MRKSLMRNKWFIFACLWSVFLATIAVKVSAAPSDNQLALILSKGVEAFGVFLNWLLEIFKAL